MNWKTKPTPKKDDQLARLLKIRQTAFDKVARLKGPEEHAEVTRCWVEAVIEVLGLELPLSLQERTERAYAKAPTDYIDALNTVCEALKKPPFRLTAEDYERILMTFELNIEERSYGNENN